MGCQIWLGAKVVTPSLITRWHLWRNKDTLGYWPLTDGPKEEEWTFPVVTEVISSRDGFLFPLQHWLLLLPLGEIENQLWTVFRIFKKI